MKKSIVVSLVLILGILGIGLIAFQARDFATHTNGTAPGTHEQSQIEAPPHPLRVKPLERTIVTIPK